MDIMQEANVESEHQTLSPSRAQTKEISVERQRETNDDVNSSSFQEFGVEKVVQEKLVYYCSSFDLNVNEWFTEYENTEIFKRRMKLKLGQNWVKYFYQAIEITQTNELDDGNDSDEFCSEETEDYASTQCLNIAIEYYLISAKSKSEESSFENFYEGIQRYFNSKGYNIVDESLFKSLAHTFHIIAESEEENISKKKKTDEQFDREYKKSGKRRELKHFEKQENAEETKDSRAKNNFIQDSVQKRKIRNMIPGFSVIKNKIITPLLIASERVVEYMIPENKAENTESNPNDKKQDSPEDSEDKDQNTISEKFKRMSLEDIERKQRKMTLKSLRKSNQNVSISKNLINKASDCVDFISERMPSESKVTRNFVTNMIELSDSALKRIAASCKDVDCTSDEINMRFITPSKQFYNILMSVWIKLDPTSIFNLTENVFIENAKLALSNEKLTWSDSFIEPTKAFFKIAKEEFMNLYKIQKDEAEEFDHQSSGFVLSMSRFFTSIKSTLLEMWNSEIVSRSALFTSASMSNESVSSNSREEAKEETKDSLAE